MKKNRYYAGKQGHASKCPWRLKKESLPDKVMTDLVDSYRTCGTE